LRLNEYKLSASRTAAGTTGPATEGSVDCRQISFLSMEQSILVGNDAMLPTSVRLFCSKRQRPVDFASDKTEEVMEFGLLLFSNFSFNFCPSPLRELTHKRFTRSVAQWADVSSDYNRWNRYNSSLSQAYCRHATCVVPMRSCFLYTSRLQAITSAKAFVHASPLTGTVLWWSSTPGSIIPIRTRFQTTGPTRLAGGWLLKCSYMMYSSLFTRGKHASLGCLEHGCRLLSVCQQYHLYHRNFILHYCQFYCYRILLSFSSLHCLCVLLLQLEKNVRRVQPPLGRQWPGAPAVGTLSGTWLFDIPGTISYRCPLRTEISPTVFEIFSLQNVNEPITNQQTRRIAIPSGGGN